MSLHTINYFNFCDAKVNDPDTNSSLPGVFHSSSERQISEIKDIVCSTV